MFVFECFKSSFKKLIMLLMSPGFNVVVTFSSKISPDGNGKFWSCMEEAPGYSDFP